MPKMLLSRDQFRRLIRRRKESGAYRWDEVWDGVYVVSPDPDIQHQWLAGYLLHTLIAAVGHIDGIKLFPSINISDRPDRWRKNCRCPDAAVFLPGNPAEDRGAYWLGGPDFLIEILSPGDRARRKLPFFAKVGVREALIIDRNPWRLELHRRLDDQFLLVGTSSPSDPEPIASKVLPLSFRLVSGDPRPTIEVVRQDGARWFV
ncbi:Uma2 family endonuclease [Tautonia rosea]|uniref:Uma2 family endonuclease n=1 Tax=Tautonia rosea TaxID=2728037 RepID=UPI0014733115|nr:Uma2 family endonuclease [Tautonia rosea]